MQAITFLFEQDPGDEFLYKWLGDTEQLCRTRDMTLPIMGRGFPPRLYSEIPSQETVEQQIIATQEASHVAAS